jgi:hypothetical protein
LDLEYSDPNRMNVQAEIDRVSRYGQQLEALLAPKKFPISSDRDALLIGYLSLLLDYHTAIVTLLPKESSTERRSRSCVRLSKPGSACTS